MKIEILSHANGSDLCKPIFEIKNQRSTPKGFLYIPSLAKNISENILNQVCLFSRKNCSAIIQTGNDLLFVGPLIEKSTNKSVFKTYRLTLREVSKPCLLTVQSFLQIYCPFGYFSKFELPLLRSLPAHFQVIDPPKILCFFPKQRIIEATQTFYHEDGYNFLNKNMSSQWRITVSQHLIKAVTQIHSQGIVHGDIKPENVLIKYKKLNGQLQPVAYLGDFGSARRVTEKLTRICGHSHRYLPPDIGKTSGITDKKGDVWACGLTVYEFLTRTFPYPFYPLLVRNFQAASQYLVTIQQKHIDDHICSSIDSKAIDMIGAIYVRTMLKVNPADRRLPLLPPSVMQQKSR